MDRLQKAALLTQTIEELEDQGSWCGETHIQKAVYLLQALFGTPTDFDFVLYRHGPFSFDLRAELTALRADELVRLSYVNQEYGPRILITERAQKLGDRYPKTIARHQAAISFVAQSVGSKNVSELERIATAVWVTKHSKKSTPVSTRSKALQEIKPHISDVLAREAIQTADKVWAAATRVSQ